MILAAALRSLGWRFGGPGVGTDAYSARGIVGEGDRVTPRSPTVAVKNSLDTSQFVVLTVGLGGVG
jgi:hypothetical protein